MNEERELLLEATRTAYLLDEILTKLKFSTTTGGEIPKCLESRYQWTSSFRVWELADALHDELNSLVDEEEFEKTEKEKYAKSIWSAADYTCTNCAFCWQEDTEKYATCHWESRCPGDVPPCEEEDW